MGLVVRLHFCTNTKPILQLKRVSECCPDMPARRRYALRRVRSCALAPVAPGCGRGSWRARANLTNTSHRRMRLESECPTLVKGDWAYCIASVATPAMSTAAAVKRCWARMGACQPLSAPSSGILPPAGGSGIASARSALRMACANLFGMWRCALGEHELVAAQAPGKRLALQFESVCG